MKAYDAAVIGVGRIGWTLGFDKKREQPASHVAALKENPRVNLVAVADTDGQALALFKKKNPGVKTFSCAQELFKNAAPQIVAVAVNESAHLSAALEAIKNRPGLLILEKPVALNLKEAGKIKSAAKKYGVPVLVNHERRFAYDYNAAADYLQNIGEVQSIEASLFSGMRLYDPAAEQSGAYSLIHDGTHLVDIVLFLLERLEKNAAQKTGGEKSQEAAAFGLAQKKGAARLLKNPLVAGISFDKKNKKVVRSLCANYQSALCPRVSLFMSGKSRFFGFEVDVIGTEGRVQIGNGFARFYRREESRLYTGFYSLLPDRSVVLPKKTGYFSNMVQNAVDFLDGRAPLKSTLQTGINALAVLEEIKAAL